MEPKTILVTGFMPFAANATNPSWEAVRLLPETVGNWRVVPLLLPVEYGHAVVLAAEKASDVHADAVLCVGLAGRSVITPEAIGINMRDTPIADNAGLLIQGEPILPDGPAAYFSTLPVRKMTDAILAEKIPAMLSYTAGTYVCNDLLYSLLHRYANTAVRVAFIHVPTLEVLPLEDLVRALTAAILAI